MDSGSETPIQTRKYLRLLEGALDIIFSLNLDGRLTWVNRRGEEISGYSRDELLRMNIRQLIDPNRGAECLERMEKYKSTGQSRGETFETTLLSRSGELIPVEVSTRLVWQDGVALEVQGIARDIRERFRLESQLFQAQKMEAVGLLACGIAHNFNNLLTSILGYTEFLQNGSSANPQADLSEIQALAHRGADLVRQFLIFSRIRTPNLEAVDVSPLIQNVGSLLRRTFPASIDLKLRTDFDGWIAGDPVQLEQVLLNLAFNAKDAMPEGGMFQIETEEVVLKSGGAAKSYVAFTVRDTGNGMDEQTKLRIFEPFFTTKGPEQGTGLGLSTTYEIVRRHRGHIEVESQPGRGSTFRIYLPLAGRHSDNRQSEASCLASPTAS